MKTSIEPCAGGATTFASARSAELTGQWTTNNSASPYTFTPNGGSKFFRVSYFFPQVISIISIGVLWSYIYHPTIGVLTSLLQFLHLEGFFQLFGFEGIPVWIGDPRTVRPAIGMVVVWQAAGFYMILFRGARRRRSSSSPSSPPSPPSRR